jgi:hypothetical protein
MGVEPSLARRAVMREVNDRILEINDQFRSKEPVLVVCECCRSGCVETIRIGRSVYERVRRQSARYALALGHEVEELERVVDRRTRYEIVDVGSD